jgi:hypothetical protein
MAIDDPSNKLILSGQPYIYDPFNLIDSVNNDIVIAQQGLYRIYYSGVSTNSSSYGSIYINDSRQHSGININSDYHDWSLELTY